MTSKTNKANVVEMTEADAIAAGKRPSKKNKIVICGWFLYNHTEITEKIVVLSLSLYFPNNFLETLSLF